MSEENNATSMKEVEIGGQKFMVPEAMAGAIEAQNASLRQEMESVKVSAQRQVESTLEQVKQMQQQPEPLPPSSDDDGDFWDKPTDYVTKIAKQAAADAKREMEEKYRAEQTEKEFWSSFYIENADLKEFDYLVKAVARDNVTELAKLSIQGAKQELAEKSRKELLKFKPEPAKTEEVVVEDGAFSVDFNSSAPEAPKDNSLGAIIRKKAKSRHESRKGT